MRELLASIVCWWRRWHAYRWRQEAGMWGIFAVRRCDRCGRVDQYLSE